MTSLFNTTAFAEKLRRMDASQASVMGLSRYMQYQLGHIPEMAETWLGEFARASPELQLALIYLVNDVLQTSRKSQATGAAFVSAFMARPLPYALALIAAAGGQNEAKARRVVIILRDRNVLTSLEAAALLAALDDPDKILDSAVLRASGGNADAAAMMMLSAAGGGATAGSLDEDLNGMDGEYSGRSSAGSPLTLMEHEVMPAAGVPLPALQAAAVAASDQLTVASAAPILSRHNASVDALFRALGVPPQLQPLSDVLLLKAGVAAAAVERAEAATGFSRDDVGALRPVLERSFVAEDEVAASIDPATGVPSVTKASLLAQSLPFDAGQHLSKVKRHVANLKAEKRAREEAVMAVDGVLRAQMALQESDVPAAGSDSSPAAAGEVKSAIADGFTHTYDRLRTVRRRLQSAHDAALEREHLAEEAAERERVAHRRAEATAAVAEAKAKREEQAKKDAADKEAKAKEAEVKPKATETAKQPVAAAATPSPLATASASTVASSATAAATPSPVASNGATLSLKRLEQLLGRNPNPAAVSAPPGAAWARGAPPVAGYAGGPPAGPGYGALPAASHLPLQPPPGAPYGGYGPPPPGYGHPPPPAQHGPPPPYGQPAPYGGPPPPWAQHQHQPPPSGYAAGPPYSQAPPGHGGGLLPTPGGPGPGPAGYAYGPNAPPHYPPQHQPGSGYVPDPGPHGHPPPPRPMAGVGRGLAAVQPAWMVGHS